MKSSSICFSSRSTWHPFTLFSIDLRTERVYRILLYPYSSLPPSTNDRQVKSRKRDPITNISAVCRRMSNDLYLFHYCTFILCRGAATDLDPLFEVCQNVYQVKLQIASQISNFRMPRSNTLPSFPVGLDTLFRSLWISFLMIFLWEATNLFFDVFIGRVSLYKDVVC
jgi:hypothetical protein